MTDVMSRVYDHLDESLQRFDESRIVGIFLQGSQNYGLETPKSDVDTKLIVTPTFDEVVLNKKPISTTHVRANNEHTDLKDIRLMLATFRKQNLNFIEILFTPYAWVNPLFESEWGRLTAAREEHEYPSKLEVLAEYGYDPKQVSHLVRVQNFISSYLAGYPYEECLYPKDKDFIMDIKLGRYSLDEARKIADKYLKLVVTEADEFCSTHSKNDVDTEVDILLNEVQYNIVKKALLDEITKG